MVRTVFSERRHRDRRTGDMRRLLEGCIRIGDALLDAARRKSDEQRFRGRRRTHEARRFFIFCEEIIARKGIRRKGRIAVERRVRRVFDGFHIRLDAILRPFVDAGRHELIIAFLPLRHIACDIRIGHPAIFHRFRRRRIQRVCPVFDESAQAHKLAVFPVHFRREQIFLLLNRRAFAFENRFIRPMEQLFFRALIGVIREIVVEETAVRLEIDGAFFGNDAVDVKIAGRIFDIDIPVRARFETVIGAFFLSGRHRKGNGFPFGIRSANHAAGDELDAIGRHRGARLLDQIAVFGLHDSRLAGRDMADIDGAAQDVDAEVLPRLPGNFRRVRANERVFRAGVSCSVKLQAPRLDVARRRLLDDILPGKRGLAGAVLHHPIEIDIFTAAVDVDGPAVRLTHKADPDIVIRFHGVLRDIRIVALLRELVIVFLREPDRIPEARGRLFKFHRRLVALIRRGGNLIFIAFRPDIIRIADESAAVQLLGLAIHHLFIGASV